MPSGDCEFSQDNARAARGNVGIVEVGGGSGGLDQFVLGTDASIDAGTTIEVSGSGDGAAIVTGTSPGGTAVLSQGAVDHGSFLTVALVLDGAGLSADGATQATEALLRLVEDALADG